MTNDENSPELDLQPMEAPEGPASIFRASDLTVKLPDTQSAALSGFTLDIQRGDVIAILGSLGADREALCAVMTRTLPSGTRLRGDLQFASTTSEKRKPIIYLGAPARCLSPYTTVSAQLARYLSRVLGVPLASAQEELHQRLGQIAGAPDIDRLRARPGALSPAEILLALLAAALAQNPFAILADEPTDGLDPRERDAFLGTLQHERGSRDLALIYLTGNPSIAAKLNGRVAVLRNGHLVEEGPARRLRSTGAHAYTQQLFRSVPKIAAPETLRRAARAEPLLQVRGFAFDKPKKHAVSDPALAITFDLPRGGSLALIGERGSGRRALARAATGLGPVPQGRVVFDAVDLGILSSSMAARLRRRIAFVIGERGGLDSRMRILDVVLEPMRHLPKRAEDMRQAALTMLARVGLADAPLLHRVSTLSELDHRRLQIARVLAAGPQLVVLYEPLAGLDVLGQALILDLLKDLRTREGAAFLLITADFAVASALCEDALVMRDSKIVERGPLANILTAPQDAYTQTLISATEAGFSAA